MNLKCFFTSLGLLVNHKIMQPHHINWLVLCCCLLASCEGQKDGPSYLFLGDSHIKRWDLATYFTGIQAENNGKGGAFISDIIANLNTRQDWNVSNYSFIVLEIGSNDVRKYLNRGLSDSDMIALMRTDYLELFHSLAERKLKVYVLAIFPVTERYSTKSISSYIAANQLLESMIPMYDNFYYIDIRDAITNGKGFLRDDYSLDGLHLNAEGYSKLSIYAQRRIF